MTTQAAPPGYEPDALKAQESTVEEELNELQQLYEGMRDPVRRRHALHAMRSLATPGRVPSSTIVPIPPRSRSATSRKRVLIVDDDSDVLVSIGGFLEAEHMDVVRASSGVDALNMLRGGEDVEAVITDVVMPGMSGVQFLAAARQLRPSLPALVITGYAELAGSQELPAGVAVLRKPFRRAEFVARVLTLLEVNGAHIGG